MLTADISKDYLKFDFLESVTYYVRTGDSTFDAGHVMNHCWFQDTLRTSLNNGYDLRKKYGAITVWMNEWFDDAVVPARGDKFVIFETQDDEHKDEKVTQNTYIVEQIDVDPFRSRAMRLTGYRINGS